MPRPIIPATKVVALPSTRCVTIHAPITRLAPNEAEWIIASRHRGPERSTAPRCSAALPAAGRGASESRGPKALAIIARTAAVPNIQRHDSPRSS